MEVKELSGGRGSRGLAAAGEGEADREGRGTAISAGEEDAGEEHRDTEPRDREEGFRNGRKSRRSGAR